MSGLPAGRADSGLRAKPSGHQAAVAAWRARLPAAFGPPPRARALRLAGGLLFLAWLGAVLWWFGFSPARLWNGLAGLLTILRLMVPPSPGEMWGTTKCCARRMAGVPLPAP